MIKNFDQWNSNDSSLNENKGSILSTIAKAAGKSVDDLVSGGLKGVRGITRKLFGASADEISKLEKGLADVINVRKNPWWQSLGKESRNSLDQEADDIVKKYIDGYNKGDNAIIDAARKESNEYIKRMQNIGTRQQSINDLRSNIGELPTRKMRGQFKETLDDAQKALDDAAVTGDAEKLAASRRYAKDVDDFFKDAGKKSVLSKSATRQYGRNGILGRGLEPGADLSDDVVNTVSVKGTGGTISTLKEEVISTGKSNLDDISKGRRSSNGLWDSFKKNVKRVLTIATLGYVGGGVWNYIKNNEQNKAAESFLNGLNQMKDKMIRDGINLTSIDSNVAGFSDVFKLFFAGDDGDLPVDDAPELKSMFAANSTVTDFFAKTCQLCFEYPEKYFKDRESEFEAASKFYGFTKKVNEKIGIPKIISAISDADGMASQALEDTFFVDGLPVSLDEHGFVSFSNPNMKILLGSTEPVRMDDLIDESNEFLSVFSQFKRKVTNDLIQNSVTAALKENGAITQEEFEERSSRIMKDLEGQLSQKEESFVAMSGLILSYNINNDPFRAFYRFDDDDLYETTDAIGILMDREFDLRSSKQLSRIYMALSSELSSVYKDMGKERTLYGVMEYSTFGFIMRSMMTLFVLENICKIITSKEGEEYEQVFAGTEIEEYQKVLIQMQKLDGKDPSVAVNGELDDETVDAMKAYQNKLGLPETGKPGERTLKKFKEYLVSSVSAKK